MSPLSSILQPTRITNVTEFELPIEETIPEIPGLASDDADSTLSRWMGILKPLRDAPGFLGGEWGRIVERPQTVVLLTDWSPAETLETFRGSASYVDYTVKLANTALNQPVTYDVTFSHRSPRGSIGRPSIHRVFFPAPVSTDVVDSVKSMDGICGDGGSWITVKPNPSTDGKRMARKERKWTGWLSAPAMSGWKPGFEEHDGREMQVAIWIHYWMSLEKESEAKLAETEPCTPGVHNPRLEAWLQQLRAVGALGWSEEHWQICPIRKTLRFNQQTLNLDGEPLFMSERELQ